MLNITAVSALALSLLCPATAHSESGLAATLDHYLERCQATGLSGVVLVAQGPRIIFEKAYGFADKVKGRPTRLDSAFDVGSITKQYTATAILKLVDERRLSLEDPLSKFFPDLSGEKAAITIRQLLNQMSGLDDDYWDLHPDLSEAQYTRLILSRPLQFTPGAQFSYSNFNYHLLKQIIEKVSGKAYEAFLRSELLEPARCRFTGFALPAWRRGQVVRYEDWTNTSRRYDASNPLARPVDLQPEGSGGLISTASDLFKWMVAVRSGKVLSASSTKVLFTPMKGDYACGWYAEKDGRRTAIYHGGFDTASGVVTGCYWYPNDDVTIVVLCNTNENRSLRHDFLVPELENIVFGGSVDYPPLPIPVPTGELEACAGSYRFDDGSTATVKQFGNQLFLSTQDLSLMRALKFGDGTEVGQTQTARLLEDIFGGKFDRLRTELPLTTNFDAYRQNISAHVADLKKAMGTFLRADQLWQIAYNRGAVPEIDLFIGLTFQQGYTVLRVVRGPDGKITDISPRDFTSKMEYALCPLGNGRFRTWDIASKSEGSVEFGDGVVRIGALRGTRQATTIPNAGWIRAH